MPATSPSNKSEAAGKPESRSYRHQGGIEFGWIEHTLIQLLGPDKPQRAKFGRSLIVDALHCSTAVGTNTGSEGVKGPVCGKSQVPSGSELVHQEQHCLRPMAGIHNV
jgi:hypothetical protein